jgi:hypothetical protein
VGVDVRWALNVRWARILRTQRELKDILNGDRLMSQPVSLVPLPSSHNLIGRS